MVAEFSRHVLEALLEGALVGEEKPVGPAQRMDLLAVEAAPLQPDDVEAGEVGAVAERHSVGDHVVLDAGQSAHEGVGADPHMLMNAGSAADDGIIAHRAMAGQHDIVGEDHVTADAGIMRDMALRQKQAMIPDSGDEAATGGARVHGDAFTYRAVRTHDEFRLLATELEVLRRMAERGEGVDLGPVADRGLAGDHDMRMQGDAVAKDDALAHEAEGPDRHVRAEGRLRRDNRGRMNGLRHRPTPPRAWRKWSPPQRGLRPPSPPRGTTTCCGDS